MLLKYIENYLLVAILSLIVLLILSYYSKYLRIFYYMTKLPGPKALPIIGNILMLVGNHEGIHKLFITLIRYKSFYHAYIIAQN